MSQEEVELDSVVDLQVPVYDDEFEEDFMVADDAMEEVPVGPEPPIGAGLNDVPSRVLEASPGTSGHRVAANAASTTARCSSRERRVSFGCHVGTRRIHAGTGRVSERAFAAISAVVVWPAGHPDGKSADEYRHRE